MCLGKIFYDFFGYDVIGGDLIRNIEVIRFVGQRWRDR